MASNFAFQPFGLSVAATCGVATSSITLSVVRQGGGTATVALGVYRPSCIRVVNSGTAAVFLAFGASAPTASAATAMQIRAGSDAIFRIAGTPAVAFFSPGTTTLNITPGEGL